MPIGGRHRNASRVNLIVWAATRPGLLPPSGPRVAHSYRGRPKLPRSPLDQPRRQGQRLGPAPIAVEAVEEQPTRPAAQLLFVVAYDRHRDPERPGELEIVEPHEGHRLGH